MNTNEMQKIAKEKLDKILKKINELDLSPEASELVDDMLDLLSLVAQIGKMQCAELEYYKKAYEGVTKYKS